MTCSKIDGFPSAATIEIEIEDLILAYLSTLPKDVAKCTVVKAALLAYALLEVAAQGTLAGRVPDPSDYTFEERRILGCHLAKYTKYLTWQSCPDECVRKLLGRLSPRAAAFIALTIVEVFCSESDT